MSKTVIMELDGVVCDHFAAMRRARQRINAVLTQFGIDTAEFWCLHEDLEPQLQSAVVEGFLSDSDYHWHRFADVCQRLSRCVGILPDVIGQIYAEETVGRVKLFDDVVTSFAQLRDAGFNVVLVANGLSCAQREKFRVSGLIEAIDNRQLYVSEEMGFIANDPRFLKSVLADNCLLSDDVTYVGGSLEAGLWIAESLGMKGVLLDRDDTLGVAYAGTRVFSLDGLVRMLVETPMEEKEFDTASDHSSRGFDRSTEDLPFLI